MRVCMRAYMHVCVHVCVHVCDFNISIFTCVQCCIVYYAMQRVQ